MAGKNMLSLVFDFNNMAMRALFTCSFAKGAGDVMIKDFSTQAETAVLIRKLAIDMVYMINFIRPDKVIVCCDAKHPWRKTLLADEKVGYKENRKKDDTKDWRSIFNAFDEYKKVLKSQNVIVYEIPDAEADDVAALIKRDLYTDRHESVVFVSSDKDWTQLADFDGASGSYCCVLDPISSGRRKSKRFSVTDGFADWLSSPDEPKPVPASAVSWESLFEPSCGIRGADLKARTRVFAVSDKVEIDRIDPDRVVLVKMACGDMSDNIPSFYEFYKNGKLTRITEKRMDKINEACGINDSDDFIRLAPLKPFHDALSSVLKTDADDIDFTARTDRQRRLVVLDPALFPKKVVEDYEYAASHAAQDGYVFGKTLRMETLLEGTRFIDKNYGKAKRNEIFDDIKDLDKYITPVNRLF